MFDVVTGASGFVGGHLVRELLGQGRRVRTPIHQPEERAYLDGLDVEIVEADVRDVDSLRRAMQGAEHVYHLAGAISLLDSDWPLLEAINITGVANVVDACLASGVRRLVHFSSFHALVQEPFGVPLDETSPLIALDADSAPYNRSKAAGERAVRAGIARGLDAVIVSPTGIVGPLDQRPSYFGGVLLQLCQGTLPALVEGGCDWVDVRDVVGGALAAAQQAPIGAKYMLSGHWVSIQDVAVLAHQITGTPPPRVVLPMWLARRYAPLQMAIDSLAGRPLRLTNVALEELSGNPNVSHHRATDDLGYRPYPFRQTLLDTLQWFAEHGCLAQPLKAELWPDPA